MILIPLLLHAVNVASGVFEKAWPLRLNSGYTKVPYLDFACSLDRTSSKQSEHMERGGNLWGISFLLVNMFVYWPHVLAQEGYLSLACGRSTSFTDSSTGIHWIPDDNYTTTGIAWSTGLSSITQSNHDSLRYFPVGNKICYTLDVTNGNRYLIRGTHVYLNHDSNSRPPEFDVAIEATNVYSVNTRIGEPQVLEVIVTARSHKLNYCLLTREGFPVISSLEIRSLPESSYSDASHGLLTPVNRVDFSDVLHDVSYPLDSMDRKTGVVDEAELTCGKSPLDSWVLKTSGSVLTSVRKADSLRWEFTSFALNTKGRFIVYLYFAELAGDRIVDITANAKSVGSYDVVESHTLFSEYMVKFSVAGNPTLTVEIEAAETSRELPCVNAVEIYQFIPTVDGNQDSDVQTLMSIKKHLNLMEWSRDPCLPLPWDGVTCEMQAGELFVTGVDLSNQIVTGLVLDEIRSLSHLKKLRVDPNELSLEIPSKLANEYAHNFRYSFLGRRLLSESSNSKNNGSNSLLKIFIGIAVGVTCFLALVVIATIVYCYRRRRARVPTLLPWTGDLSKGPNYVMKSPLQDPKHLEMQSSGPQELTLKEVQTVTEKFKSKIGEGGFGAVYYGTLPNGTAVAVKVRSLNSNQGTREFTTELKVLRKIKHENLVPLVGFCTEYQQQILVYPYMSNGSLHDRLYDKSVGRKPLDWLTRLDIVLGAARGINFLHTGGDRCIIHRDVKSSNILLDDSMKAKIADFGLSKYSPLEGESVVSTEVRGTAEYLDPEYYQTHQLTELSDVYSFGIVLLETVCGREPLNMNRPRDERSLLEWVRPYIKDANIQQIVDPEIQTYTPESLWRVLEIALQSVEPHSSRRPIIGYIVRELEDALIIENNASQYMASIQSLDSLCIPPNLDLKDFPKKEPMSSPLTFPFEPSPVFSETMNVAPDPR